MRAKIDCDFDITCDTKEVYDQLRFHLKDNGLVSTITDLDDSDCLISTDSFDGGFMPLRGRMRFDKNAEVGRTSHSEKLEREAKARRSDPG